MAEYRVTQDGMHVAGAIGAGARREIDRLALRHARNGPVEVQEWRRGRWVTLYAAPQPLVTAGTKEGR